MTKNRLPTLAILAAVAGCAAPPDHFHTLRPAVAPGAAPVSASGAAPRLAIGPVTVPDALARDEWVIRTGDTGAQVYGHQLWMQGLGADIAQSLADYLDRGGLPDGLRADAGPTGSGSGADLDRPAPLRLRVQVLRLDSMFIPAPAIFDDIRWTIECLPSGAAGTVDSGRYRMVRSGEREAGGPTPAADPRVDESQRRFDQLARAHSDTVRLLAEDVAAALRATAAERATTCVAPD